MTQAGEHTWDILIQYHRCPQCGLINESREGFQVKKETLEKEVSCLRCRHAFVITKKKTSTFGPLFGSPQPIEFTWE